jgi:hypothetical protein
MADKKVVIPNSKKRPIIIAAIFGIALLVVIAISLIVASMSRVSAEEYTAANDQVRKVSSSLSGTQIISPSLTDEQLDQFNERLQTFKTENAKLNDLVALQRDNQLKPLYQDYKTKADQYVSFNDQLQPSLRRYVEISREIRGSGNTLTEERIRTTIAALENRDEVTEPTIRSFLDDTLDAYKRLEPLVSQYQNGNPLERITALGKINQINSELTTKVRELVSDINQRFDETNPRAGLQKLRTAVADKA